MLNIMPKFHYHRGARNYHLTRADHFENKATRHREAADNHLTWILEREAETKHIIDELRRDVVTFQARHARLVNAHMNTSPVDTGNAAKAPKGKGQKVTGEPVGVPA